jgi:plastocyanin
MGHWSSAFRAFLLASITFFISSPLSAHGNATLNDGNFRVLLSEWSLEIDTVRVGSGIVRVRAVNEGTLRHNLTVTKAGTFAEIYQTRLLGPGEAVELPLLFEKGEYDLYCAVPGHRRAGMIAYLIVDDAVADVVPISLGSSE